MEFIHKFGLMSTSKNLYRLWRNIDAGPLRWPSFNLGGDKLKQMEMEAE